MGATAITAIFHREETTKLTLRALSFRQGKGRLPDAPLIPNFRAFLTAR